MAKSSDQEIEQIKELLGQVNKKLSSARVLNGGFDKLELEVSQIKDLQTKLNSDFESHKVNDERLESKIDKLYDPETGIYAKVQKTENMISGLSDKISGLAAIDEKLQVRLSSIETKADTTQNNLEQIKKITGEDNKELRKSIRLSKGFWWFLGFTVTGLLSALGKLIWDLFVG